MSRAHMLYDNKALQSIPVKVTNWDLTTNWSPEEVFQIEREGIGRNSGIMADGILLGRSRHLIIDKVNEKNHYMVFHIDVTKACRRKYDTKGEEIQPDFGTKQKVNTGFLMSSYKDVSKEGKDVLGITELQEQLRIEQLQKLTKEKEMSFGKRNAVSLWFNEQDFDGMEFGDNAEIRCRTKGKKCYLESITLLNPETKNLTSYTSEKPLGGSWTDKVMSMKDNPCPSDTKADDQGQGDAADDDEWV